MLCYFIKTRCWRLKKFDVFYFRATKYTSFEDHFIKTHFNVFNLLFI